MNVNVVSSDEPVIAGQIVKIKALAGTVYFKNQIGKSLEPRTISINAKWSCLVHFVSGQPELANVFHSSPQARREKRKPGS